MCVLKPPPWQRMYKTDHRSVSQDSFVIHFSRRVQPASLILSVSCMPLFHTAWPGMLGNPMPAADLLKLISVTFLLCYFLFYWACYAMCCFPSCTLLMHCYSWDAGR